jgi:hypothetical protein
MRPAWAKSSQDPVSIEKAGYDGGMHLHPSTGERIKRILVKASWGKKRDPISKITRVEKEWRCGSRAKT